MKLAPNPFPAQQAVVDQRRLITRPWLLSFQSVLDKRTYGQGTHEERVDSGRANYLPGALYWETDRTVLYQLRVVDDTLQWVYVSGTMTGTLSPDERPTDLGPLDAGFQFASTDTAQIFLWDGTAWVDITPVPPPEDNSVQIAKCTSVLALTTTPQTVPGCSVVLTRAGQYLVVGCFDFAAINDPTIALIGGITGQPGQAIVQYYGSDIFRATVAQQWMLTGTVGQTVELSAYKSGGSGSSQVMTETTISATWISP